MHARPDTEMIARPQMPNSITVESSQGEYTAHQTSPIPRYFLFLCSMHGSLGMGITDIHAISKEIYKGYLAG